MKHVFFHMLLVLYLLNDAVWCFIRGNHMLYMIIGCFYRPLINITTEYMKGCDRLQTYFQSQMFMSKLTNQWQETNDNTSP